MFKYIKIQLVLVLSALFIVEGNLIAGEIHKWIGPNGEVHYGSRPPPGYTSKSQKMNIKNAPSPEESFEEDSSTSSADSDSSDSDNQNAENDQNLTPEQKAKVAEVEKKNAEIRKKNCSVAKRRVAGINQGGRLYEVNEKGERHYWNDSERKKKLADAQASVSKWCK